MTDSAPTRPRKSPCASCPYRCNVPSGIWNEDEYDKLPAYDGGISEQLENAQQSLRVFLCHQKGRDACAGWLGHRDPTELLAVRVGISRGDLDPSCAEYETVVPLFASGEEAAEHGKRAIAEPWERASAAISKIITVRGRAGFHVARDRAPIRRSARA